MTNHVYKAVPAKMFKTGTLEEVGYAMFIHRDGFPLKDALTKRKLFKTAQDAQDYYDRADRAYPDKEVDREHPEEKYIKVAE